MIITAAFSSNFGRIRTKFEVRACYAGLNSAFRSSPDIRIMSKSCLNNNFILHGKKKIELLALHPMTPHTYLILRVTYWTPGHLRLVRPQVSILSPIIAQLNRDEIA